MIDSFELEFTSIKAEQAVQGMELQEWKEGKDENHIRVTRKGAF